MTRYTPLWEQAGSYAASVDRRLIAALWPNPSLVGCALTAVGGTMQINVAAGQVAVPSQNSTGSTLCVSDAVEVVTIAAAAAQPRIDLIICRPRATDLDGGQNNDFIFDTVAGVPAASPVAPAVPAGTVALAQVAVAANAVAITQANITDLRPAQQLLVPQFKPVPAVVNIGAGPLSRNAGTYNFATGTMPSLSVPGTFVGAFYGSAGFSASSNMTTQFSAMIGSNSAYQSAPAWNNNVGMTVAAVCPCFPLSIPANSALPVTLTVVVSGANNSYCGGFLLGQVIPQ